MSQEPSPTSGPRISNGTAWHLDGAGFEEVADPAPALLDSPEVAAALAAHGERLPLLPATVYSLTHRIPIAESRHLHVTESFTLKAWHRWPRRAALMLGGPVTRGSYWSIPVPGYDGPAMMAERGFFAYTVDYLGVGESYRPDDGNTVTLADNVAALRQILRYVRFFRAVPKVDVVAESIGGAMATQLAADGDRVRGCVISTILYKTLAHQLIVSPEWTAFLNAFPDGYTRNPPESYDKFLVNTPNEQVRRYTYDTQPGGYPAGPFRWLAGGLPYFDPGLARVPGLILVGKGDFVPGPDDPHDLAADYGTDGAKLVILDRAGHVPRIQSEEIAASYWAEVFNFIDP
jgi:pimeloyl-ACP methyl ester carboxylesterase